MEYILTALRAGFMLTFLCSVHMETPSMNEEDVPDTDFVLKSLVMTGNCN